MIIAPQGIGQGGGQAPEALVAFVFQQAAGGGQADFAGRQLPVFWEVQPVQVGQLDRVTGGELREHVGGGVHLLIQVQHYPGDDGNAEVLGKARHYLRHEHRIGIINAEVEGGLVGLAAQYAAPLQ